MWELWKGFSFLVEENLFKMFQGIMSCICCPLQ